jgi:phosphate-selective porin OprO and OprP
LKRFLLLAATASFASLIVPARAAEDGAILRRLDRMQKMIEAQQKQIEAQKKEIENLKGALGQGKVPTAEPVAAQPAPPSPVLETRLKQQDRKIDDLVAKFAAERDERRTLARNEAKAVVTDGRLSVSSADGRFSAELRLTAQYDQGYYMQAARARSLSLGPDLSSGGNFRRLQFGIQGRVFGDWSYTVKMDYGSGGGTGVENPGKIQQAYIEYDGLKPFLFRIGNHSAATGLDEAISGADLLLPERAAASDLARGMGSSGRNDIELLYEGNRLSASLAYTDGKIQSGGFYDEQQALVTRLAYSPVATEDWRWVVSLAGTDVFRPGDQGPASNSPRPFSLSVSPELVIDDNAGGLVSVSESNVTDAWNWNLESAVRRDNVMVQAGYYKYGLDRRGVTALRGEGFDGWYAEASWVLTGEPRGWSISNAGFTNPRPGANFDPGSDAWGAWELAGRFSELNLNDHAGTVGDPLVPGGVRGGEQRIAAIGLNWYPNAVLKFMLQAQNVQISRIGTNTAVTPNAANADLGQNFDTIALRSQIAF